MNKSNNILITGITGQDGIFLTSLLLNSSNKNIYGLSRSQNSKIFYDRLGRINTFDKSRIKILNTELLEKKSVKKLLEEIKPEAIFNLSGPSSVNQSFENNNLSNAIKLIFENLTSSLIELNNFCFFFQSSSSEMFGKNHSKYLNEESEMIPNSPYAAAKYDNHILCKKYSEEYEWKIVSGIMFNHESEFRKKDFLIPKIISTAKQIKLNKLNQIVLGSLDLVRDWTYAEDVAIAITKLFENSENIESSYVIGTGKGKSIKDILKEVSLIEEIDLLKFVKIDKKFLRINDPLVRISNPEKLKSLTFWEPRTSFSEMLSKTAQLH